MKMSNTGNVHVLFKYTFLVLLISNKSFLYMKPGYVVDEWHQIEYLDNVPKNYTVQTNTHKFYFKSNQGIVFYTQYILLV